MAISEHHPQAVNPLAHRLAAARRRRVVGREAEMQLFRAALLAVEPPFAVLHVHGPGGVGKSTLLREYSRIATESGRPVIYLDGRHMDSSPPGFLLALPQALGRDEVDAHDPVAGWPINAVFLIDTYEILAPLDGWLRENFLPQLSGHSLVVIAGRNQPESVWRADIGWRELTRILPLRNLRPEESQTYLATWGVPEAQHAHILAFTHGPYLSAMAA
jgi:hypothetical protein